VNVTCPVAEVEFCASTPVRVIVTPTAIIVRIAAAVVIRGLHVVLIMPSPSPSEHSSLYKPTENA
jgi:hypothetical protein